MVRRDLELQNGPKFTNCVVLPTYFCRPVGWLANVCVWRGFLSFELTSVCVCVTKADAYAFQYSITR